MTMTRKDFIMIAETIREYRAEINGADLDAMAETFARKLASRSATFNYARFIEATK